MRPAEERAAEELVEMGLNGLDRPFGKMERKERLKGLVRARS